MKHLVLEAVPDEDAMMAREVLRVSAIVGLAAALLLLAQRLS